MSEDALNASIMSKWEAAGLDAASDSTDIPSVDDDGSESTDDTPADDPIVEEAVDAPDEEAAATTETDGTDTPVTDESEVETPPEPAAKETEEQKVQHEAEDELAKALGLPEPPDDPKKRAQWWKTRLPYSQVHKIVTEREKKLGETHASALKERDTKVTDYETRFADVGKVEDIITNKPQQYVKTLAAMFPETYGKMFAPLLGDGTATAEQLVVDEADPGPEPEPDYELKDAQGNVTGKTYSLDGMRKLREWERKVTEQNMLKRFKPHMDFVKEQQTAAEAKAQADAAEARKKAGLEAANVAVAEVRKWDLGEENINEIVKVAATLDSSYDARLALALAYNQVVIPKLKANRDEMLAQILKDQKKASAKQTAAGLQTQTRSSAPAAAQGDINDRIKAAAKRAGLKL